MLLQRGIAVLSVIISRQQSCASLHSLPVCKVVPVCIVCLLMVYYDGRPPPRPGPYPPDLPADGRPGNLHIGLQHQCLRCGYRGFVLDVDRPEIICQHCLLVQPFPLSWLMQVLLMLTQAMPYGMARNWSSHEPYAALRFDCWHVEHCCWTLQKSNKASIIDIFLRAPL